MNLESSGMRKKASAAESRGRGNVPSTPPKTSVSTGAADLLREGSGPPSPGSPSGLRQVPPPHPVPSRLSLSGHWLISGNALWGRGLPPWCLQPCPAHIRVHGRHSVKSPRHLGKGSFLFLSASPTCAFSWPGPSSLPGHSHPPVCPCVLGPGSLISPSKALLGRIPNSSCLMSCRPEAKPQKWSDQTVWL